MRDLLFQFRNFLPRLFHLPVNVLRRLTGGFFYRRQLGGTLTQLLTALVQTVKFLLAEIAVLNGGAQILNFLPQGLRLLGNSVCQRLLAGLQLCNLLGPLLQILSLELLEDFPRIRIHG